MRLFVSILFLLSLCRPGCRASGAIKVPSETSLQLAVSTHVATAAPPRERRRACCHGAPDGETAPQGEHNRYDVHPRSRGAWGGRIRELVRRPHCQRRPSGINWPRRTPSGPGQPTEIVERHGSTKVPAAAGTRAGPAGPPHIGPVAGHRAGPPGHSSFPAIAMRPARSRSCPHCARRMP